ncbi:MAG: hypothetical protein AAF557_22275 [Pseudomonadota bacterium]
MSDLQEAAENVVKRIVAASTPAVSADDAHALMAAPKRTLMMDKLLAVHFNMIGDFAAALEHAKSAFTLEETPENAKNIALMYRKSKRTSEGIAFCKDHEALLDPMSYNDILSMLYWDAKDDAAASLHGDASLALKDKACGDAPKLTPHLNEYDPEQPKQNLIVFSLWGEDPRYLTGAQNNVIVARYLYPGWICRFYVDRSVPDKALAALLSLGAQVIVAPKELPAAQYGLFWRFLVEDDESVALYICRDADSVMNIKERAAVEDWLASGKAFHIMRDLPIHAELILAGMWGAHRGNIGNMRKRVVDHVSGGIKKINNRITDQEFLRMVIWPIVKQDVLIHGSHLSYGATVPFRDEFRLPKAYHIGQNDWVHHRPKGGG